MEKPSLSQKILNTIKSRRISPKPRWEFLLKNYIIWAFFTVAIIIGSLATSVIIFMILNDGWGDLGNLSPRAAILANIPYFWLALLALFLVVAYYNIKHTKKGYKYNPYLIILASVVISIGLGIVVYSQGVGEELEEVFYQQLPFYKQLSHQRGRLWAAPIQGRLAGVIIESNNETELFLRDFEGKIWTVKLKNLQFRPGEPVQPGDRLKITGQKISETEFMALLIEPFYRHGPFPGMRPGRIPLPRNPQNLPPIFERK